MPNVVQQAEETRGYRQSVVAIQKSCGQNVIPNVMRSDITK